MFLCGIGAQELIVHNQHPLGSPVPRCKAIESYLAYYHRSRTHLGLDKDAPEPRPVQGADAGEIAAFPQVGGLHASAREQGAG